MRGHVGLLQSLAPHPVHGGESLTLQGQLMLNVLTVENWLKVHPLALQLNPLINHLTDKTELLLPICDPLLKRLLVGREAHGLGHHNVIIQLLDDYLINLDDVCASFSVLLQLELHRAPLVLHLVQSLLNGEFLASNVSNLDDPLLMIHDAHFEASLQGERLVWVQLLFDLLANLLPVAVPHSWVPQGSDHGNVLHEVLNLRFRSVAVFRTLVQALIRERFCSLVQALDRHVNALVHLFRVKLDENPGHPLVLPRLPCSSVLPQRLEWLELRGDLLQV